MKLISLQCLSQYRLWFSLALLAALCSYALVINNMQRTQLFQATIDQVLSDDYPIEQSLRRLLYQEPDLSLITLWKDNDLIYPGEGLNNTLAELSRLKMALPYFEQLLKSQTSHPLIINSSQYHCWENGYTVCTWSTYTTTAIFMPTLWLAILFSCIGFIRLVLNYYDKLIQTIHDLASPLSNVHLYTYLLGQHIGFTSPQPYLDTLQQETNKAKHLLYQLNHLMRRPSLRHPKANSPINYSTTRTPGDLFTPIDIINEHIHTYLPTLLQQRRTMEITVDSNSATSYRRDDAHSATQALNRILSNLLDNVVQHSNKGLFIYHCNQDDDSLSLLLKNERCSPHVQTPITINDGTGLASCKSLCKAFGWHLLIDSDECFVSVTLTLPKQTNLKKRQQDTSCIAF